MTNKYFYIIEAHYSSSGGCHGTEVHKKDILKNLLQINPVKEYIHPWNINGSWDFWISETEDLDDHVYQFDESDRKWETSK